MARSKKPVDDTQPTGANGILFINYDLSDADRVNLKKWKATNEDRLEDMINNAIDGGFQISLKRDTFNDCIGAYLIAKETKTENDGYILCGRSSTAIGALFGVFYRHYAVFEGVWPVNNRRANPLDDID